MTKDLVGNIVFSPYWGRNLFRDFDKVFDEAFGSMTTDTTYPPTDIYVDEEEKLFLEFALAGFSKDEIKIEMEHNILYISSDVKTEPNDRKRYVKHRIARREFKSAYKILEVYDYENPDVSFNDGILRIVFDKREVEKPKRKQISL